MRDFRELKVWEKSHRLVLAVYRATATFPRTEQFGLMNQIRRASASIPANIVHPVKYMRGRVFYKIGLVE